MWYIFMNAWEKCIFCCFWMEYFRNVNKIKLIDNTFQVNYILLICCLLDLSIPERVVLKSLTILVDFVYFSLNYICYDSYILMVCYYLHSHLRFLCLLGKLIPLSLCNSPLYPWKLSISSSVLCLKLIKSFQLSFD